MCYCHSLYTVGIKELIARQSSADGTPYVATEAAIVASLKHTVDNEFLGLQAPLNTMKTAKRAAKEAAGPFRTHHNKKACVSESIVAMD